MFLLYSSSFVFLIALVKLQVFDNGPSKCDYYNDEQHIQFKNTIWNVTGIGRNAALQVYVSPCGSPLPSSLGCEHDAVACVLNTRRSQLSVQNAGKVFEFTTDYYSKAILVTSQGQQCADNIPQEQFRIVIQFDCEAKDTAYFIHKDDCEIHIGILNPSCTPACTTRLYGHLIDLRPLQSLGTVDVLEPLSNKTFAYSFCHSSSVCTENANGCETTGGNINNIATFQSELINYNAKSGRLTVKSHYGSGRGHKDTEIVLECNWNSGLLSNLKYIVPQKQGKKFKFLGESSLGCIKLPMNCIIHDTFVNYLTYNLTSLNREGGWHVLNVSIGTLLLNICGPLRTPTCLDHSQNCLITWSGKSINYGSIPVEVYVKDNAVYGRIIDGDICEANKQERYNTEIILTCSNVEKGPILESMDNCTCKIIWKTPAACSKLSLVGENDCLLQDITGHVNLNGLSKPVDRILHLNSTAHLRYNLCGNLNSGCRENNKGVICLVVDGRNYNAVHSSKTLQLDDNILSLSMIGKSCNSKTRWSVQFYFHCDYLSPSDGIHRLRTINDYCQFEVDVYTVLACPRETRSICSTLSDNVLVDLSPLSLNSSNYIIKNGSIEFIINVCRSIAKVDNFCPANSGICLRNSSELAVHYRYKSLGNINKASVPVYENDYIVMRYSGGSYCIESATSHSTVIRFYCSSTEGFPRLMKEDACSHEFRWDTRSACGTKIDAHPRSVNGICKYKNPITGKYIDLSTVTKNLKIKPENDSYTFSICESTYIYCKNDRNCTTQKSSLRLLNEQTDLFLEYSLSNQCDDESKIKLRIYLKCNTLIDNASFNLSRIGHCYMWFNLHSRLFCPTQKLINFNQGEEDVKNKVIPDKVTNLKNSITLAKEISESKNIPLSTAAPMNIYLNATTSKNCTMNITNALFKYNLESIKPFKVHSHSGSTYNVFFNESSSCGFLCKEGQKLISSEIACPTILYSSTSSSLKVSYSNDAICDDSNYYYELSFTCDTSSRVPFVTKDEKCHLSITYPLEEICTQFKNLQINVASSAGIVLYSSIGISLLIFILLGGAFIAKRYSILTCCKSQYQEIDQTHVVVYCKNKKC